MSVERLEKRISYIFHDKSLAVLALTHSSLSGEKQIESNQRLEFLGDAVLQLVMSERLYRDMPSLQEGMLSRLRARSVQESALCEAARGIKLGEFIRLGRGEEQVGGRERPSILADTVEALLGAVYLDGGLDAARSFVDAFIVTAPGQTGRDYKTELQEKLQKGGRSAPRYEIVGEEGPPHARRFIARVYWQNRCIGDGEGRSKKAAEQAAAHNALESGKI